MIRGLSRLLDQGDLAGGIALCERGLEQLRLSGHLRRYAHDLAACGAYLSVVGDNARAQRFAIESEALARQLGDQHTLGIALNALGYTSIASDPERARSHFKEAIGIGAPWCAASAWWGLGWVEDTAGDDPGAIRCYEQALELWSGTGDWRGIFMPSRASQSSPRAQRVARPRCASSPGPRPSLPTSEPAACRSGTPGAIGTSTSYAPT